MSLKRAQLLWKCPSARPDMLRGRGNFLCQTISKVPKASSSLWCAKRKEIHRIWVRTQKRGSLWGGGGGGGIVSKLRFEPESFICSFANFLNLPVTTLKHIVTEKMVDIMPIWLCSILECTDENHISATEFQDAKNVCRVSDGLVISWSYKQNQVARTLCVVKGSGLY